MSLLRNLRTRWHVRRITRRYLESQVHEWRLAHHRWSEEKLALHVQYEEALTLLRAARGEAMTYELHERIVAFLERDNVALDATYVREAMKRTLREDGVRLHDGVIDDLVAVVTS